MVTSSNPGLRTYKQWCTLPTETLKLHCASANLDCNGDVYDLALRIFRHYNSLGTDDLAITTTSAADAPLQATMEEIAAEDQQQFDWLFPAVSTFVSVPLAPGMPTMSAPDGGFDFTITSATNTIPRITIRRQDVLGSTGVQYPFAGDDFTQSTSTIPSVLTFPTPTNGSAPPSCPAERKKESTAASSQHTDLPGSSSMADNNADNRREIADVKKQLTWLQQSVAQLVGLVVRFDRPAVTVTTQTLTTTTDIPTIALPSASTPLAAIPPIPGSSGTSSIFAVPSAVAPAPMVAHAPRALPPLPQRLLILIARGQYVSFDLIFAATAHVASARAIDRTSLFSLAISTDGVGGPALGVLPRALSARERVTNFHAWSTAFNLFMRCATFFRPHLSDPLVRYQGLIAGFTNAYVPSAWLAYDIAFRHHVANNPHIPWDRVDEEIFTVHLRCAQSVSRCFSCHATGHFSAQCPRSSSFSARGTASFSTSSHSSASRPSLMPAGGTAFRASSTPPSSALQRPNASGTPVCLAWNGSRGCLRHVCRYLHQCTACGGPHRRGDCNGQLRH